MTSRSTRDAGAGSFKVRSFKYAFEAAEQFRCWRRIIDGIIDFDTKDYAVDFATASLIDWHVLRGCSSDDVERLTPLIRRVLEDNADPSEIASQCADVLFTDDGDATGAKRPS